MTLPDDALNAELLNAELPDPRFESPDFLTWIYDDNPDGPAVQASADEDGVRMAHYALLPQRYRNRDGEAPLLFSLHAVTRRTAQGKGYWVRLGEQVFADAAAAGHQLVIGVPNDKSTPSAVKYLDYRLVGPMPVTLMVRGVRRGEATSRDCTAAFLAGDEFARLAEDVDGFAVDGWVQAWNRDRLAWRLAWPGLDYALHWNDDLVAVSSTTRLGPARVAVVMKLLPRGDGSGDLRRAARRLVNEMCRHHRAPLAVYAGWNRFVGVRGLPVPMRVRPAPLNVVVRSLDDRLPQDSFTLDIYEFLDADAY